MTHLSQNPFENPIKDVFNELKSTVWEIPYIPQIIKSFVLIVLLIILPLIYITIGVISQISQLLWNLIVETTGKINSNSLIDASGYAIANAIYFILFVPLWLIQFPFLLIGWSSRRYKTLMFIIIAIVAIIYIIKQWFPNIFTSLF